MNINRTRLLTIVTFALLFVGAAHAQFLPGRGQALLLPANPTSADALKLSMIIPCRSLLPYIGNPYRVSMSQNNITVMKGEVTPSLLPLCPPSGPREEIDLGRLPAGNYTVSVIDSRSDYFSGEAILANAPFTVTDARATKAAPYVRLDYSGHWWDPNDSGWGLFIWHDARSSVDNILAAWFTYTPDGKPMWYVFQPRWQSATSTFAADLAQVSRLPGTTSPPATRGTPTLAGTASLDFTNFGTGDDGKITYTFTGGPTLVRNITKFKP